ncbi:hypothetical protein DJICPGNB_26050 [Escherichia coli]|nr:hypothetical protein DJICPGNB_26050 [Escherichia coli]
MRGVIRNTADSSASGLVEDADSPEWLSCQMRSALWRAIGSTT